MDTTENIQNTDNKKKNKTLIIIAVIIAIIVAIFIIKHQQKIAFDKNLAEFTINLAKEKLQKEGYTDCTVEIKELIKTDKYSDRYSAKVKININVPNSDDNFNPFPVAFAALNSYSKFDDYLVTIDAVYVHNQHNELLCSWGDTKSNTDKNESLDDDDLSMCWVVAKNAVKAQLKAPSTAKFPFAYGSDGVSITCEGNIYTVTAWVDAENSFGALIRSNFTVLVEKEGTGKNAEYKAISCIIE